MSRAFRLGVFIVTTLAILAIGVFLIGEKRYLFQRTYQLRADFQDVSGLESGADVQVGGMHMGTVRYISLPGTPNGKLTVAMDISDSTKNIVRRDSVATIKTEGLLGNKYIEISFGSEKAPNIENGDAIKGVTPEDFSDAAVAAMNQAKTAAATFADDADALKHNFLLRGFFQQRGYDNTAELRENKISKLPARQTSKDFTYDAKSIFDKPDDAKLKDEKKLDPAGQFLEQNKFSLAVVAASNGAGDAKKDRVLTEARAKVVRDYLVQKFQFDDSRVKIIGLGKSSKAGDDGKVEILVYD